MIGNFKTINPRTIKDKRGNTLTMFSGAIAYLNSNATQTFFVQLSITNGTTEYYLDRVQIQPGDSVVWTEDEYGVILDEDQYVKILCTSSSSFSSNDNLSVFLHTKEVV